MRRAARYIAGIAILIFLAGAGAAAWLLGTTAGADWLLSAISRNTALKISAHAIEGRLLDHLRLQGVQIVLPQKEAQLDSMDIRWHPLLLLGGTLSVNELVLQNVRILDTAPAAPKKEPVLAWPQIPTVAELLEVSIGRLEIDGLTYRRPDHEPIRITAISASVAWRETLLSVRDLTAVSPSGRVAGTLSTGFVQPSLQADLAVTPPHPLAEMNLFFLHAKLLPGRGQEQLAGSVVISGRSGDKQRLELSGEAGMTRKAFNLRNLRLVAPGRSGAVTGEGTITLTAGDPLLALQMKAADLDLDHELKRHTDLSGSMTLTGTLRSYRGHLAFRNRGEGWQALAIAADYQGSSSGMTLAPLSGSLLDGAVEGSLAVGWNEGITVKGRLRGSNLNPERLAPAWNGVVNFDFSGSAAWSKKVPLRGEISGKLLKSSLHGQPLKGEVRASYARKNLVIRRLALQGKGFDIHAAGQLDQRLDISAHVSSLSLLVPGTAGKLRTDGWVRWRDGLAAGALTAEGGDLKARGIEIAAMKLSARLAEGAGYPVHLAATLTGLSYGRFHTDSAALAADGTIGSHALELSMRSTGAEARIGLTGGYTGGTWSGKLVRLSGRDSIGPWTLKAPAAIVISSGRLSVASLAVTGSGPERLEIEGDMSRKPLQGSLRAEWHRLNAARANHWVTEARVSGSTSGAFRLTIAPGGAVSVAGEATAMGILTVSGHRIDIQRSSLTVQGGGGGLHVSVELHQAEGGTLKVSLASSMPARMALPEEGKIEAEVSGIDLQLLRPWFPAGVDLQGTLAGRAAGRFLPNQRLELDGQAAVTGGRLHWQKTAGEVNADLRTASASWAWRGETLRGSFALALAEEGRARGTFELPLPAHLPLALDPKGRVRASLDGHLQEKGLLNRMFPGLVQESHGEIEANVNVTGTWADPQLSGTAQLAKAGAYLPTAGIRVENVQMAARFEKNLVHVDSFEASSGEGRIGGTAVIRLKGRQVASYRGSIKGDRFRTIYFPELQLLSSPDLTFEGTPEKLVVRGEILLPELLVQGPPIHNTSIEPSKDVVVEGRPPQAEKAFRLALDVEVRVTLGDRVLVKSEGLDAELGGAMDLSLHSLDKITSRGEIKVVKGNYRTYGVNLKIVRGRVFYAGGPIRQPALDILALRTIGDIRAGVTIVGTPQAPIVKLYSEPAMPDVDILAYIVLGHPLGSSSGDQAGLMAGAAAALLSGGQSVVLQDEIKHRLGLSTLELETTTGETAGLMGYKEIQVTPPGKAPAKQAGVSQTMLTVGKYLTPELYISYGRSLFTGGNLFRLRYDLFKHWQIQSETGSESGVDLYYKIDFK